MATTVDGSNTAKPPKKSWWKRIASLAALVIGGIGAIAALTNNLRTIGSLFAPTPVEISIRDVRGFGALVSKQQGHYEVAVEFTFEKTGDAGIACLTELISNGGAYVGKIDDKTDHAERLADGTSYLWLDKGGQHGIAIVRFAPVIVRYVPTAEFRLQCSDAYATPYTLISVPNRPQ